MNQAKDLQLLTRIRFHEDDKAKEELVQKYLPMIRHILKHQNTPYRDFEDFFQEGAIGLLKAIDEYDPENYHIKFSTFAYICILRRVYNTIKQSFSKKSCFSAHLLSLNATINEEDSRTLIESLADDEAEPFSLVEAEWISEQIAQVMEAYLSPVECKVVQQILVGSALTDIQKTLGLSSKVIDNARTRARIKLKKVLLRYGSLLNQQIPMKTRKRKDLAIRLEVG